MIKVLKFGIGKLFLYFYIFVQSNNENNKNKKFKLAVFIQLFFTTSRILYHV